MNQTQRYQNETAPTVVRRAQSTHHDYLFPLTCCLLHLRRAHKATERRHGIVEHPTKPPELLRRRRCHAFLDPASSPPLYQARMPTCVSPRFPVPPLPTSTHTAFTRPGIEWVVVRLPLVLLLRGIPRVELKGQVKPKKPNRIMIGSVARPRPAVTRSHHTFIPIYPSIPLSVILFCFALLCSYPVSAGKNPTHTFPASLPPVDQKRSNPIRSNWCMRGKG